MHVYRIVNTNNGKQYIGQSIKYESRWKQHIRNLRKGKHHNDILQRAWNKYGEPSFRFEVVVACSSIEELQITELLHIEMSDCMSPNGYNLHSGGAPISDKFRNKLSAFNRGKILSEEHRRNISESHKGKKQGTPSAETRQKQSLSTKNIPKSEATKKKMKEAWERRRAAGNPLSNTARKNISDGQKLRMKNDKHPLQGKTHTEETKKKISETKLRKIQNISCVENSDE